MVNKADNKLNENWYLKKAKLLLSGGKGRLN